jgi:hypothetical protein
MVSTTGNISMNTFLIPINLARLTIVMDTLCIPAVETAGYIFF